MLQSSIKSIIIQLTQLNELYKGTTQIDESHRHLPDEHQMVTGRNARKGVVGNHLDDNTINNKKQQIGGVKMRTRKKPTPFGRAVRMRLAELDMLQSDLADQLGISRVQITYLIYGERGASEWIERICHALDMPVESEWKKGA